MALAKVLIVEDHDFTRELLVSAVSASGCEVVASGKTAIEAVSAVKLKSVEVALLDLDLGPGPGGIDIAMALRKISPSLGIVFLTSFRDPRLAHSQTQGLPPGSRYLVKNEASGPAQILKTILQAKFDPLMSGKSIQASKTPLSDKQIEIVKMLAKGFTNREIAERIEATEKSVEHSIARVFSLLGLPKSTALNQRIQIAEAFFRLTGK